MTNNIGTKTMFNRAQREGLARVNDGLAIASIIAISSFTTNHLELTLVEAGGLIFSSIGTILIGYFLRRE